MCTCALNCTEGESYLMLLFRMINNHYDMKHQLCSKCYNNCLYIFTISTTINKLVKKLKNYTYL